MAPAAGLLVLSSLCASCRSVESGLRTAPPVSVEAPRLVEAGELQGDPAAEPAADAAVDSAAGAEPEEARLALETDPLRQGAEAPPLPPGAVLEHYAPNLYRRFGLSVGGAAYGNFDTSLRIGTPLLVGAILDLEDFLDVDDSSSVLRIDADYSFNRRHRIDLSYFDIRRSGATTVTEDIEVGEVVLPAGDIRTRFNTQIFKLAYRYNFVTDYRTTIGVSGGLHTMRLDLGLDSSTFSIGEEFKATAPLPLLGIHAAYALNDDWRLRLAFEFLQVKLGDYSGFIADRTLALEHDLFKHVGWGVAYNGFDLDVQIERDPLTADIEYGYQGLLLYLRTYF